MSDSGKTNWTGLDEQVADLQVKAFLRVIFEMGEVLDKNGHPTSSSSPMPGTKHLLVRNPQAQTGNLWQVSQTVPKQTNYLLGNESEIHLDH
jgi:hypothetical protein